MATNPNNLEQQIKSVANDIAVNSGAKNTQDFIETNMRKSRSNNIARSVEGSRAVGDFTAKLLQLTLYQSFSNDYDMGPYSWIDKFETKVINAGNSEQFSRALISGADTYVETNFIPQSLSYPQLDSVTYIKLYKSIGNGSSSDAELSTINTGSLGYKYLKPLTIIEDQWVPYFKSGKLTTWVADQINLFRKTYTFFRLNKIETMLSHIISNIRTETTQGVHPSTTGKVCRYNGTAGTMLECFTKEIFPEIEKMRFFTNTYNLRLNGDANGINNSSKDELLMFVNQATYTKLTHGVLAQVFNNKLAEIESILPKENIIPVSNKVTDIPASGTAITMTNTPLIDDNQVLIISKNSIKHLQWLLKPGSIQTYDQNLARQFTFHAWGAYGFIPWGQCFLYQNDNLRVA